MHDFRDDKASGKGINPGIDPPSEPDDKQHINSHIVFKLEVPIPPTQTQQSIANIMCKKHQNPRIQQIYAIREQYQEKGHTMMQKELIELFVLSLRGYLIYQSIAMISQLEKV